MTKTYKITAEIYFEAENANEAEEKIQEILEQQVSHVDIEDVVLEKETDDSICFMCEERPKQVDNDMCPQCWKQFLLRQERGKNDV